MFIALAASMAMSVEFGTAVYQSAPSPSRPILERGNGLATVVFPVPEGTIRVYLPDDMMAGDTITGTVVAEPKGTTEAERNRNADVLSGMVVETPYATPTANGRMRTWKLSPITQAIGLRFELKGPNGRPIAESAAPVLPPRVGKPFGISVPPVTVVGHPLTITGPFDGNAANTNVKATGLQVPILAESPGKVVAGSATLLGDVRIDCSEGDLQTSQTSRFILFNLQIADPVIQVGRSTTATLRVRGLEGIQQPIPLILTNHSPNIVRMEGGDVVPVQITKADVGAEGRFEKQLRVTATGVGTYTLSLQASNAESSIPTYAPQFPPFEVETDEGKELTPTFEARLRVPNRITGSRPTRISAESVNPHAPMYSASFFARREPNGAWEPIGIDGDPAGGFAVDWDRSDLAGGTYTIRLEAAGGDGQTCTDLVTVSIDDPNGLPAGKLEFGNRDFQRDYSQILASYGTYSNASIDAHRNRANRLRGAADSKRDQAREQEDIARAEWEKAERLRRQSAALAELDNKIERALAGMAGAISDLVKRIEDLKGELAGKGDPAAIDKAVADLEQANIDCEKECEKKKQELADAEKKIEDIEKRMEEIANEVNDVFQKDGWSGSARFDKAAGIIRWGFSRSSSGGSKLLDYGSPEYKKYSDLRREKDKLKKDLKKAKEDRDKAKDALNECEKECERKKKALEDAKKAQAQKDEAAAAEAQIDEKTAELDKLLAELEAYLKRNPDLPKDLADELKRIREQMPIDAAEWEDFKKKLEDFLKRKAQVEEELKNQANDHDKKGDDAKGQADGLRGEARGLDDEAWREDRAAADEEAERRRQEAAAAEEARKRDEERRRAAAAAKRDCMEQFKKWIQDNIDKGILPEDALEKFENWLKDMAQKIPDLVEVGGKVAGGATSPKPGAGAVGLAEGLLSLGAAIFYWWAEAELKGAVARLGKKIDERTKQYIALELAEQRPKKPCGIIYPKQNSSESWFYFRKGNKVLMFKITRDGGLECMGEMSGV